MCSNDWRVVDGSVSSREPLIDVINKEGSGGYYFDDWVVECVSVILELRFYN